MEEQEVFLRLFSVVLVNESHVQTIRDFLFLQKHNINSLKRRRKNGLYLLTDT